MKLRARWEFPAITANAVARNPLLFELETPPAAGAQQKLVVVLALDRSWSMKGAKMQAVIDASVSFLNWLTRNDYLGVVAYAEDVKVIQRAQPLTEKTALAEKIRRIQLGTSTNLSGGWIQALRLAQDAGETQAIRRVILLTDGQATLGVREPEKLVELARDYAKQGVHTSTIGFGEDFNEQNLRQIARAGEGNFYFIETPEQASEVFYREFGAIRSLYAQAPEIRFRLPPEIELVEVLADAEIERLPDGALVRTGDIPCDDKRAIAFDFKIHRPQSELFIEGEITYLNVQGGMKDEKLRFKAPLRIGGATERNSDVAEEFVTAFTARAMEKLSALAAEDAESAAAEVPRFKDEIEKLMAEKNVRPQWLVQSIDQLTAKILADGNLGRKQLLAESTRLFKKSKTQSSAASDKEVLHYKTQGNLDMYKIPEFKETMNKHLASGIRFVIMDFTGTEFIDSSSIGALIELANSLVRRGGNLVVHSLNGATEKIFQATRLTEFVPVVKDESAARELIGSA